MASNLVTDVFVNDIIKILSEIASKVYLITKIGNKKSLNGSGCIMIDIKIGLHFINRISPRILSIIIQAIKIAIIQTIFCLIILRINRKIDSILFFVGGALLLPSVILSKLLRKRVLLMAMGLGSKTINLQSKSMILSLILRAAEKLNFILADKIIVESASVANDLKPFNIDENKIVPEGARFVDLSSFKPVKEIEERKNTIGFIGRLDRAKGILEFLNALPMLIGRYPDLNVLIVGDGPLRESVEKFILENNFSSDKVKLLGFVPHESIPSILNELKILILPSYSEGLPTIIIEAMACGTPVITYPVGGIPDIVKNGKTGFFLEDISSKSIFLKTSELLADTKLLEHISKNARRLASFYSYDDAIKRWKKIIQPTTLEMKNK